MSKQDQDWIDDLEEDPIVPDRVSGKHSTHSAGWKFYLRIKDLLPDWWEEFNGSVVSKKSGPGNKYRNIQAFVKVKVKDRTSRQYLLWMIGPKEIWEESKDGNKHEVPWLGDWYQRRKNGYWLTGNKTIIKDLRKSIRENLQAGQAIRATAPFIVQILLKKNRLAEKIDEAFGGEPFYSDEKPDSKNNRARFHAYKSLHDEVDKSMYKAVHEWMRIHGINPRNPHEMADMATLAGAFGQVGASAALTGLTAGLGFNGIPNSDGSPSGRHLLEVGDNRIVISPDALLLASHLTSHEKTFSKSHPLPVIDQELKPVEEKEDKPNGKHKAN